ncbi:hypothetical protein B0T14DRAFT_495254 [Immersiella caudata]|uniref:Uncharacterized protein n=1 Tax=Immersiella caudata TaxID=314043 RepID=A0AA39WYD3_9PEZI|nr:hypothetical protein B0T14DRAFT_495254 [Immersiella caudata]
MAFFPLNQGGLATGVAPVSSDADELLRTIVGTGNKLSEVAARLQPTAAQASRAAIDRLERALMKAYYVAAFIRGDYDGRQHDQSELDDLLEQTVGAFEDAEAVATAGLRKLGEYTLLAAETGVPVVGHAKEEINQLKHQAALELAPFQGQFESARKSADQAHRNIKIESQAYKRAQEKYEEDMHNGNGSMASGQFMTSMNSRRELEEIGRSLRELQRIYDELQELLATLQPQRQALRIQLCQAEYLSALLPSLDAAVRGAQSRGFSLQTQVSRLKDTVARLVRRARDLQQSGGALRKHDFALYLLEMCRKVLIDPALADGVRMIRNEIVNGYSGNFSSRMKEAIDSVDESMRVIAAAPSICGEIRQTM